MLELLLNLIIPFVMILVGYLFMKHPVWDMESHNGYNTPTSRKSQAHWDYAQSIAPGIFISLGKKLGAHGNCSKRNPGFASYLHLGCRQCGKLCGSRRSDLRIL